MENKGTLAIKLAEAIKENGGSYDLNGNAIKGGYVIGGGILKTDDALATIELETIDGKNIGAEFLSILKENEAELEKFDGLGVWVSDGVIYLDAITKELHRGDALELGQQRKQQAIGYISDKGNFIEITLSR